MRCSSSEAIACIIHAIHKKGEVNQAISRKGIRGEASSSASMALRIHGAGKITDNTAAGVAQAFGTCSAGMRQKGQRQDPVWRSPGLTPRPTNGSKPA